MALCGHFRAFYVLVLKTYANEYKRTQNYANEYKRTQNYANEYKRTQNRRNMSLSINILMLL